jgi:hypothetical protein
VLADQLKGKIYSLVVGPSRKWRRGQYECRVPLQFRLNKPHCLRIVGNGKCFNDWRISAIPNAVRSRLKSGCMPDTTFHPSHNQAALRCALTHINRGSRCENHDTASPNHEEVFIRFEYSGAVERHSDCPLT